MPLIVMGLSHATFSEGGRKAHLGYNEDDFVPESTFCGIENAFAFNGPENVDEHWIINNSGVELCKKCGKAAINQLRQAAKDND